MHLGSAKLFADLLLSQIAYEPQVQNGPFPLRQHGHILRQSVPVQDRFQTPVKAADQRALRVIVANSKHSCAAARSRCRSEAVRKAGRGQLHG